MTINENIRLKPTVRYALLSNAPLLIVALVFLWLAWTLSPYFILFSVAVQLAAWYRILHLRSYEYVICGEFVRLTRGIFFRRTDQLEMFRIKDYILVQSLPMRLLHIMHLTLKSTDPENPVITLKGIRAFSLVDEIRSRVQEARRRNNIVELS